MNSEQLDDLANRKPPTCTVANKRSCRWLGGVASCQSPVDGRGEATNEWSEAVAERSAVPNSTVAN